MRVGFMAPFGMHGALRRPISSLLGSLLAVALVAEPAAAYVDPGAGSMIIQGIIAAAVGGAVAIRLQWRRVKGWLSGTKSSGSEADEPR